jgi:hypothetical protein
MSPRNEVFQAIPFHASPEVNESLIAAGDADEEEEQRPEEQRTFSRCKVSALILGLLVGAFIQFSILGAHVLFITLWGEDLVTKSKANIVVFSLLWGYFTAAVATASLGFLRNLVRTITYSAIGGSSNKALLEEMVWHMLCRLFLGGFCLAWTVTDVLLFGMRAQTTVRSLAILVVALVWCKIVVMCFATDNKPSLSRQSSMEETVTAV